MKILGAAALALAVLSAPALAQDNRQLCQYMERHVPSADTAYQPGVDANGAAVAPADLGGGSGIKIPERIQIYITPDLFQLLNIPGNPSYFPNAAIGVVEADQHGALTFNGQPISQEANSNLVAYCQRGSKPSNNQNTLPKKDLLKGN